MKIKEGSFKLTTIMKSMILPKLQKMVATTEFYFKTLESVTLYVLKAVQFSNFLIQVKTIRVQLITLRRISFTLK